MSMAFISSMNLRYHTAHECALLKHVFMLVGKDINHCETICPLIIEIFVVMLPERSIH